MVMTPLRRYCGAETWVEDYRVGTGSGVALAAVSLICIITATQTLLLRWRLMCGDEKLQQERLYAES